MVITSRKLKEAVEVLWGRGRMNDAADSIGCDPKTLRGWIDGKTEPPTRFYARIRRAVHHRLGEIQRVVGEIGFTWS